MKRWQGLLLAFGLLGAMALIGSDLLNRSTSVDRPERESGHYASEPIAETIRFEEAASSADAELDDPRDDIDATMFHAHLPTQSDLFRSNTCQRNGDFAALTQCLGRLAEVQFDAEGRDQNWANTTENIILIGMTPISAIITVTGLTVECRETLCRLHVAFASQEDLAHLISSPPPELLSDVFLPMLSRAGLQRLIVPYAPEADTPERTYYFAR